MQHWVFNYYLFYDKVKFGPLCFCMGKGKIIDFSETVVVYDLKLATDDQSDKKFLRKSKLGDCLPLPQGYIHVLNHENICMKSEFRVFSFFFF